MRPANELWLKLFNARGQARLDLIEADREEARRALTTERDQLRADLDRLMAEIEQLRSDRSKYAITVRDRDAELVSVGVITNEIAWCLREALLFVIPTVGKADEVIARSNAALALLEAKAKT
jgi:multidrug resistance efflux pump